jgi:aminopeptidase N
VSGDTATDLDFLNVARVVAHEYFHNWTGNRVTCRNWFQLGLKEGMTVFRENLFMEQNYYKSVQRINDVKFLKTEQFPEDSGPLAHPVRPKSYIEINNFYTYTVYYKGAEMPRMLMELLGWPTFRKVMDLFFKRHDGEAVTIEDFIKCVEDITGQSFAQFQLWYDQAGTPELSITAAYEQKQQTLKLNIKQSSRFSKNKPFLIPLSLAMLDQNGKQMPLQLDTETKGTSSDNKLLQLKQPSENFTFINLPEKPVLSLLRNFSAPVRIKYAESFADLQLIALHDKDIFNRWQALQDLSAKIMLKLVNNYQVGTALVLDESILQVYKTILYDAKLESIVKTTLLQLPTESYLLELMPTAMIEAVHDVSEFMKTALARVLKIDWFAQYHAHACGTYEFNAKDVGKRALKNLCLSYLSYLDDDENIKLCLNQYNSADNMTDILSSLTLIANSSYADREALLDGFYQKWQNNTLVVDKWLGINATIKFPDTLARVQRLIKHPAFSLQNPNKVYALLLNFAKQNHINFHKKNGDGYKFIAEQVMQIDAFNPQLAARLLSPLLNWQKFTAPYKDLMREQLQRILAKPDLSPNVKEVVTKAIK